MTEETKVYDVDGRDVKVGDTVATISGGITAKVCAVMLEGEAGFVRLRALHQPFSRGVWHAADRVQRLTRARKPAAKDRRRR